MIGVEFEATRRDMAAFQRFVTGRIRRSVRSPAYFGALILLAVIVGGLLSGVLPFPLHQPTALVIIALGAGFWLLISRLYRHAAAPLEQGSLVGPRRIELDEHGVRQIAPLHEGHTQWPAVLSVDETATHVFLMTDSLAGYIIPRRAFRDDADREAFVAFARERAGRRA